MNDNDIEEGIESLGSTPQPPLLQPQRDASHVFEDAGEPSWRPGLRQALRRQDWMAIQQILDEAPEAIRDGLGKSGETPLDLAIKEGLGISIIRKLLDRMLPEDLDIRSTYGYHALHHLALSTGDVQVAKLLVKKNPHLPNARVSSPFSMLPIVFAAQGGHRELTFYLHSFLKDGQHEILLRGAVDSGLHDYALLFLDEYPEFAESTDLCTYLWRSVIGNPRAFLSGNRLNLFQSMIYSRIPMDRTMIYESLLERKVLAKGSSISSRVQSQRHSTIQYSRVHEVLRKVSSKVFEMLVIVGKIKEVRELKLKHYTALELVRRLCKLEMKNQLREKDLRPLYKSLCVAIQSGLSEVVEEMLQAFPDLLSYYRFEINPINDIYYRVLHLAVLCRNEKIFNNILQQIPPGQRSQEYLIVNGNGDTILHLAARQSRQQLLDAAAGSRATLQLQNELQWYKGLEQVVPPQRQYWTNNVGKTAIEVFDEEHQEMVRSETGWMLSMANSCIVGGSLIATVVFAAAITVPGGNKDNGAPNFSKATAFKVFAFSDTFALISSLITVVVFLSIFTSRYSLNDFLYDLPNRLIIGLISLLLSVTFMMVAFSAIFYLVFAEDNEWIIFPIVAVACTPIIFFAKLQLPSLLNMMKSTYGHNVLKQLERQSFKINN